MRSNKKKEQWLIDQYNRNRPVKEWIIAFKEIKERIIQTFNNNNHKTNNHGNA